MTSKEKERNKDVAIYQDKNLNMDTIEGQEEEEMNSIENKDASAVEVSHTCCDPGEKARGMVFFYLLLPIVLAALYVAGTFWFFYYPFHIDVFQYYDYTSYSILAAFFINAPLYLLYFLTVLLRCYFGKPLNGMDKIVSEIVIFSIWTFVCAFFFDKSEFVQQLDLLCRNTEPIFIVVAITFLVAIFKACCVILCYAKANHSVKIDLISCTALCVVYILICNFFILEGGLIYLVSYSEQYTITEDFPIDKLVTLESFCKFAELNGYKRERFFNPGKQISYGNLLTMAAISPAFLSYGYRNYPKFYVRYLTNEILYPLSEDLAKKEYWGRKLTVSSEHIEDHFYNRKFSMGRDIFLARQYLSVLSATARGNPEAAYKQWIGDKSPSIWWGRGPAFQMTPEEEKEWFYWYKTLWPQIEDFIDPDKNNKER